MTTILKTNEQFEKELQSLINSHNIVLYKSNDFIEGNKLGQGGFGKVVSAKYLTMKCAIKKIKEYNPKEIFREIYIMKKYSHPYIPVLYGIILHPTEKRSRSVNVPQSHVEIIGKNVLGDSFFNESSKKLAVNRMESRRGDPSQENPQHKADIDIVLEIIEGDTLERLLKQMKLTDLEKLVVLLNLATVLEYLHEEKIIHRDLKPANIMIDKKFEFKLLDFGISKLTRRDRDYTRTISIGTMCYMAPENFILPPEDLDLDETEGTRRMATAITDKVDVWAFGCIVQEVFTGVKPWVNKVKSDSKILALLYSKKKFEIVPQIPKDSKIRELIEKCVIVDPEQRITIKEAKRLLLEILYDSFMKTGLTNKLQENFSEGLIQMYKTFDNISNKQKFHLLRKLEYYIFEHLQNIKLTKNYTILEQHPSRKDFLKNLFSKKKNFLSDFQQNVDHSKNSSLIGMFLQEAKRLDEEFQLREKQKLEAELKAKEEKDKFQKIEESKIKNNSYTKGVSCIKKVSAFEEKNWLETKRQKPLKKVVFLLSQRTIDEHSEVKVLESPRSFSAKQLITPHLEPLLNQNFLMINRNSFTLNSNKPQANKALLEVAGPLNLSLFRIEKEKPIFTKSNPVNIQLNGIPKKKNSVDLMLNSDLSFSLNSVKEKSFNNKTLHKSTVSKFGIFSQAQASAINFGPGNTISLEDIKPRPYHFPHKSLDVPIGFGEFTPKPPRNGGLVVFPQIGQRETIAGQTVRQSPESNKRQREFNINQTEVLNTEEAKIPKVGKIRQDKGFEFRMEANEVRLKKRINKEFAKPIIQNYGKDIILSCLIKKNNSSNSPNSSGKLQTEAREASHKRGISKNFKEIAKANHLAKLFLWDDPLKDLVIKNAK